MDGAWDKDRAQHRSHDGGLGKPGALLWTEASIVHRPLIQSSAQRRWRPPCSRPGLEPGELDQGLASRGTLRQSGDGREGEPAGGRLWDCTALWGPDPFGQGACTVSFKWLPSQLL